MRESLSPHQISNQNLFISKRARYEIDLELHINFADPKGNIKDIKNDRIIKRLKDLTRLIGEEEGIQIKKLDVIVE